MKIRYTDKIISDEVIYCNTVLSQIRGLMFRKPLSENQALLIKFSKEETAIIHTLFVFFPIDVIWLNSNKQIVDMHSNLSSFCIFKAPKQKAKYIIEVPAGTINKHQMRVGDQIFIN